MSEVKGEVSSQVMIVGISFHLKVSEMMKEKEMNEPRVRGEHFHERGGSRDVGRGAREPRSQNAEVFR